MVLPLSSSIYDSEAVDNVPVVVAAAVAVVVAVAGGGGGGGGGGLGSAFRFVFQFLTGLIFRNPRYSADYFRFRRTHVGIESFQGKINLFWNPTESRILAGIPEGRTLEYCILCHA